MYAFSTIKENINVLKLLYVVTMNTILNNFYEHQLMKLSIVNIVEEA